MSVHCTCIAQRRTPRVHDPASITRRSQAVPGRYRSSGHLNEFEEHLGSLLHAAWLLMAVVDRLPQDLRDVERQADIEIATMISEGIFISARSIADRELEIAQRLVGAQGGDAARFDRQQIGLTG